MTPGNSADQGNPLAADLDHVLACLGERWKDLQGARVFLTGGTGFFGCWLLETLLWANDHLTLNASAVVLTRNARAFGDKAPHLAFHPAVTLHAGDVRTFDRPAGAFTHVIHAATDSPTVTESDDLLRKFDTIVEGARRTLEFARQSGATRFLLTSTGSVYGRQPPELHHMPEDHDGGYDPSDAATAGAEAKRAAETLCALYADAQLQPTIARCFAFVGPYLPLDAHFAAGNFVRDALRGNPIAIAGDGTPIRSYLYASDLAIWLWTILLRGRPMHPYNVGSEREISIAGLADAVARQFVPMPDVRIAKTPVAGRAAERYVPSTARARQDLGVAATIELEEALKRTADWYRKRQPSR